MAADDGAFAGGAAGGHREQETPFLKVCGFFRASLSSITDQATAWLRQGMVEGRWREKLPGREQIAAEVGCSQWTVKEAVKRLAKEGLLVSQGAGHRQRIVLPAGGARPRALRVGIFP
jgi:hypothetical protein